MAFSLNKLMLIGNLGQDAETRFTTNNLAVTTFSLATVNSYKGKDGNYVNDTTWHNITAFSLPDFIKDSLKKGKKIYVEGRLTIEEYTDKEGIKRKAVKVVSEKIIPLERNENHSVGNNSDNALNQNQGITENAGADAGTDDDLPF